MHYCVSDIHGNADALNKILEKINFSDTDDELYVLGDVCDRQSYGIHILLEFMKHKNVHLIRGNHEEFILKFYDSFMNTDKYSIIKDSSYHDKELINIWMKNGGLSTMKDLLKLDLENHELLERLIQYIYDSPYQIDLNLDTRRFILRHNLGIKEYELAKYLTNNVDDIYQSIEEFKIWDRNMLFSVDYPLDVTVIFGHTPVNMLYDSVKDSPVVFNKFSIELWDKLKEASKQTKLKIFHFYNQYCIDCGAAISNNTSEDGLRLACLRLEDMAEFYSNDYYGEKI